MKKTVNFQDPVSHDGKKKIHYYKDFSANTSLHGVKYTAEEDKSPIERVWWGIMVIASFLICIFLVGQVWRKWVNSPIIVSFDETLTPVWKIPFPAVTVCPMAVTNANKFNYTEICATYSLWSPYDNETVEDPDVRDMFDLVSVFCKDLAERLPTFTRIVNKTETVERFKNMSLTYNETLFHCQVLGSAVSCNHYFSRVMTDMGLCYTMNMLGAEDIYSDAVSHDKDLLNNTVESQGWNVDEGYPKGSLYYTYPRRARGAGKTSGLNLYLTNNKSNTDYQCSGIYKGFAVLVHPPDVVPKSSKNFIFTPYETDFNIVVKPEMMYTSERLQSYKPEQRQCYFSHEKKLRFFKTYNRENCETECNTNFTMAVCGCVSPGMPRNESMPLCAGGSRDCIDGAMEKISVMENIHDIPDGVLEHWDDPVLKSALKAAFQCNCLQSCNSLTYQTTVHHVQLEWGEFFKTLFGNSSELKRYQGVDFSLLSVYIEKPHFIMSKRSELYGITEFLANCGGLIGVCLGFSILSLVEVIYFFCIRFICNLRCKKSVHTADDDKLSNVNKDLPIFIET